MNKKRIFSLMFVFLIFFTGFNYVDATKKKSYDNWQEVAVDMNKLFIDAIDSIKAGKNKEAYKDMNDAYFGYYEVQGFETTVMNSISTKRVTYIEGQFRDIKHQLLGNKDSNDEKLIKQIKKLDLSIYKDAMVLDGIAKASDSDDVAKKYLNKSTAINVDKNKSKWTDFTTALFLLVREGLEAILVIVAIITYLVKCGYKHLIKRVYMGCVAGIVFSIILAIAISMIFGNSIGAGVSREMFEGFTMFIAVLVLFYVSNWMLSKANEEKWESYIHEKVNKSISEGNANALIFAAFISVAREGSELVLFYIAQFSGGRADYLYIILGFLLGCVILAIVYLVFRYTTVRLPLKAFFTFTSLFMFLLCISFMGKGVKELSEANVIVGSTIIPAMHGFSIEELGIYDRAETIIPQFMIAIAGLWVYLANRSVSKSIDEKIKKDEKNINN